MSIVAGTAPPLFARFGVQAVFAAAKGARCRHHLAIMLWVYTSELWKFCRYDYTNRTGRPSHACRPDRARRPCPRQRGGCADPAQGDRRRQGHDPHRGQADARSQYPRRAHLLGRFPRLGRGRLWRVRGRFFRRWHRLDARGGAGVDAGAVPRGQLHPRNDAYQGRGGAAFPAGVERADRRAAADPVVHVRRRAQSAPCQNALWHRRRPRIPAARADEAVDGAGVRGDFGAGSGRAAVSLRRARAASA